MSCYVSLLFLNDQHYQIMAHKATRNSPTPDLAQLTGMVYNLQTDLKRLQNGEFQVPGTSELIESIRRSIIKELDDKVEIVKSELLRELEKVRTELNIKLEADANATIRAVTGFYTQLDSKVTELKINNDVYDERTTENSNKIDALSKDIEKWSDGRSDERSDWSDAHSTIETRTNEYPVDANKLLELEKRLDSMEDQSRRDNLLFYNFEESNNEDCETLIKNFVCKRVLNNDPLARDIKIVRAHRLGKPERDVIRPIIVKYREFSDKVNILKNSKNIKQLESEPVKPGVSEDFSLATKRDREFLKTCIASAKQHLGDKIDYGFIKYK